MHTCLLSVSCFCSDETWRHSVLREITCGCPVVQNTSALEYILKQSHGDFWISVISKYKQKKILVWSWMNIKGIFNHRLTFKSTANCWEPVVVQFWLGIQQDFWNFFSAKIRHAQNTTPLKVLHCWYCLDPVNVKSMVK